MGLVWEEKTSELPAVQGRKRPLFPCWPRTTYLIKSLSVFGGSNGISEVATAIGFWDSPMCWHSAGGRYFDKPPIQTTSVPVYLVNIEWGQICTNSKSLCKASGYIFYVHTVMLSLCIKILSGGVHTQTPDRSYRTPSPHWYLFGVGHEILTGDGWRWSFLGSRYFHLTKMSIPVIKL